MDKKKCGCEGRMFVGLLAGAVLASIAGFALGWSWRDAVGLLQDISLLSVMTAFGTLAASLTAIGVAGWQYRKEHKARYEIAVHAAASSYLMLSAMSGEIRKTYAGLEVVYSNLRSPSELQPIVIRLGAIKSKYKTPDPILLNPLSGGIGVKLASAFSQFDLALILLGKAFEQPTGEENLVQAEENKELVIFILNDVCRLLEIVYKACQMVALPLDSVNS